MKSFLGQVFSRWSVIGDGEVARIKGYQIRFVLARCQCGTEKTVRVSSLLSGVSQSCGCLKAEKNKARYEKIRNDFWSKVDVKGSTECWLWKKSTNEWGYGTLGILGRSWLAHRRAWAVTNGEIPEGVLVLHTCDNPPCCNPDHLFLGTNNDNMAYMVSKGRGRAPRGEASPNAKLADDDVREIRRRYADGGISQAMLGEEFGVSQVLVGLIVRRKAWAYLDGP